MTEERPASGADESVWSYRGYHLRPSEFTTAMVHYYRAEIQRSNTWRMRLDNTTNWAVVTTSAAISFALSSPNNHHGVLLINTLLIAIFLWIEARRYRYYELWAYRARLMETDFFAAMLAPPFAPHPEWAENLAETLLTPEFPISIWEAFGRRFRRNYFWIFLLVGMVWALKVYLHPVPAAAWAEFVTRSALGPISGTTMLILGLIFNGALVLVGILTAGLTQASGEVLPKFDGMPMMNSLWRAMRVKPDFEPLKKERVSRRRRRILALVVTKDPQAVSEKIIKEMKRSGTLLSGQGIYSHQDRPVLMVALTVTEVAHLKSIVSAQDPQAFVVVMPTQEILGGGFQPLEEK
ncbi:MAG: hypothetical protein DPW18_00220 [Chloroflexi bacterium]|jgi:uncharacterized membrane protein|nr:hypothetical protein [Anaerolineales bacterium]MCQ3935446.1 hypothetical protein [Chloroflexota bacterium]MDL1944817.1 DUF2270 domain-containing protein [Chloroflexi bacterium CFX2]HAX70244.1 hypothetical protein [Anaerolineae bacterium]HRJ55758.1 DUF2270 domain-containing protein [Anaerolineales bacterium]